MKFNLKFSIINLTIFFTSALIIYILFKSILGGSKNYFYYLKYLFLFIPFLLLNIFIKYRAKNFQKNYSILLITSLICIYILEIFLLNLNYTHQNFQFNENKRAAKILGTKFDKRTQHQVVMDLKDKNAVPSMSRTVVNVNGEKTQTLGGIGKRLTVLCNEEGKWITFNSDRYGFNNPDELWDKKIHMMILGDSSGLGMCVEQEENFAGYVRKKSDYNALQVGGTGMGSLFEYAIFREYLFDKKIENLIIFFLINDIDNMRSELNNNILKKYLSDKSFSQSLKKKQYLVNQKLENHYFSTKQNEYVNNIKRVIKVFHLRDYVKNNLNLSDKKSKTIYENFELDNDIFNKILDIYKKIESEFDGNFSIGFDPVAANYLMPDAEKMKLEKLRNEIIKKFEFNGFKVINFHDSLKNQPVDKILPFGKLVKVENHFTSFAHGLFADQILEEIHN